MNTRQSGHDYVGSALDRQSTRFVAVDRLKVQIPLDAIRSIEMQLQGGSVGANCKPPTIDAVTDFKPMEQFPALVEAEMDLITAALACGVTRVVTLALGDGEGYDIYFPCLGITGNGHELSTRH